MPHLPASFLCRRNRSRWWGCTFTRTSCLSQRLVTNKSLGFELGIVGGLLLDNEISVHIKYN